LQVRADPVRLAQALDNLLHNACKYTPEGGEIRLSARADGAMAEIRVADTGIGIAPDDLESVFELFSQGEPGVDLADGGLGIGLALVRRLISLHGGTVHAESAGRHQGTTIVLRLPRD
jgi:signal transduction histidine kinase